MKYSETIKKLRLRMCLTQAEFATLFNVSFAIVNRRETDSHKPTMKIKILSKEYFEKEKIDI